MSDEQTTLQLAVLSFAVQRLIALQCLAHPELREAWDRLPVDVLKIMDDAGVAAAASTEEMARDLIGGLAPPAREPA